MPASQASGFIAMREASFHKLSSLLQQLFPALALDSPAVGVDRVALFLLAFPVPPAAIRLRSIAAYLMLLQGYQCLIAMIAFVVHHFAQPFRMELVFRFGIL